MINFSQRTKFLLKLSQKASRIILKYYNPCGVSYIVKNKTSDWGLDAVTKADMEVNKMVLREIEKHYPTYDLLGEEISSFKKGQKLFVVDPIDGTHMFIIGAPLFVFSAAVVINGKPVAGVLANPLAKRTLLAELDGGAYLVERNIKLSVSNQKTFNGSLIRTGWKDCTAAKLLHRQNARTPEVYAVCESASLIATGGFDGDIFMGNAAHDIAAVKIVVEEAGGRVTNLWGQEQKYDRGIKGAIITNGHLHKKLVALVKQSGLLKTFQPAAK